MKSAKMIRMGAAFLGALICLSGTGTHISAAPDTSRMPGITLNGEDYSGKVKLKNGVTYVKIREFSEIHGAHVTWDRRSGNAVVSYRGVNTTLGQSANYLKHGNNYLHFNGSSFVEDERIYVPLRAIGNVFGYSTTWNSEKFSAALHGGNASSYTEDELYWLSRIISAEAEGESYRGKLAVGTVVLNRVKSSEFPNTIYGVIFDRKNGVQFTPVANGTIYKSPDKESIAAARACLEGGTLNSDILFFMNASLAESFWISSQRRYVMTVGNHDFYA